MSERFLNDRVELHCGDCLDVLARLDGCSIDSCVTDPPYGLQFMGREWDKLWRNGTKADAAYVERTAGELTSRARKLPDYNATNPQQMQAWHEAWARAVYRVLKPGAHLIAMGGTRTYHRLACAIEDAGFEIRDTLSWNFGSGFPKSHDVGKRLDASKKRCTCDANLRDLRCDLDTEEPLSSGAQQDLLDGMQCAPNIASQNGQDESTANALRNLREDDLQGSNETAPEQERILQLLMPKQDVCRTTAAIREQHERAGAEGQEIRQEQSGLERRGDISQSARQLRERPIREMPTGFDFDGENGRILDGAPLSDGADDWAPIATDGVRASSRPSTVKQHGQQSGTVAVQSEPQERGAWPRCGSCGKPIVPDGLGTALKPAMELLCLARKPLSEGTVAANVMRWGTGAINVDGCRVAGVVNSAAGALQGYGGSSSGLYERGNGRGDLREGRWPANICTDGSDEVVAAFPDSNGGTFAQSGERAMRNNPIYGAPNTTRNAPDNYGDSGNAARFFKACPLTEDDLRWARNRHDDTLMREQIDGSENGENPEAERFIASLKTDGCGSVSTDQSKMDLMSTTSTTIAPITESKISNLSQEKNTTPIINDCAKPIEPNQTEALAVNVSDVPNGKHSTTFTSEWPEHSTDIANDVSGNTCRNGETETASTGTPIIENIAGKRFHYTSKADADDRLGSRHPTVKPLDLMQWLVRLITPKNGKVLDPFSGTGTTGEAAWREGMAAVLIEAEPEYQADIRRRMALALSGPDERNRESIKAKNLPRDDGPLFAALDDDYNATDDFARSIDEAYRVIRARKANGGKGWGESE